MGGESKRRGSRDDRVKEALERKQKEIEVNEEKEMEFCYHQKYFYDNIHDFSQAIKSIEEYFFEKILIVGLNYVKKNNEKEFVVKPPEGLINYPFKGIIIKKTKVSYKYDVLIETTVGDVPMVYHTNGTAGWFIKEKENYQALEKCFVILASYDYAKRKMEETSATT